MPSSTETLLALGADVIACTRFCEQPSLTTVGGTKNPEIEAIVALAPDIVVMDVEENRREDAAALQERGLTVLATDVHSVDDALEAMRLLAEAAGRPVIGGALAPFRAATPVGGERRTALVPIWRRPWMVLGPATYGASLLERLAIDVTVPAGAEGTYPVIELDDAGSPAGGADVDDGRNGEAPGDIRRPDLVVVPSEPYAFKPQHLDELRTAFPASTVVEVDGQDLFWWGSRTVAAMDRLRSVLDA